MKRMMIGLFFCLVTIYLHGQEFYMYVGGQKRSYEVSATKLLVKSETFDVENAVPKTVSKNVYNLPNRLTMVDMENVSKENLMELQQQWNTREDVIYVSPILLDEDGKEVGSFTNQVIIRLKTTADYPLLIRSVMPYQIKDVKQSKFDGRSYLLTLENGTVKNAMQTANELYETGFFEYVEPNLIHFLKLATNDTYFNNQWALKNTGQNGGTPGIDINVEQAWGITTGSSDIRVAVLDVGVDVYHPDLKNNLDQGYDATGKGSYGVTTTDPHGTACIGIILAEAGNGIGIAGVAHGCRGLPVRIAMQVGGWTASETEWVRNGIEWAWNSGGADVISMSFEVEIQQNDLIDAIGNATKYGRNNKGCVLVAASGNVTRPNVAHPASFINVIAVGGIKRNGQQFGGYGAELNIVAPGDTIYTTDIRSSGGYNDASGTAGDYYSGFTGTSAACPHVAGIAALMLSVNPSLRWDEVMYIIGSTAGNNGLVNAYAAVVAALPPPAISGNNQGICYSGEQFELINSPGGTIYWTVTGPFSVPSTGNPVIVTRTGTGTGSGILTAKDQYNNILDTKTITPCTPVSISGVTVLCSGSGSTFSVSNAPVGFTWDKSSNLTISGSGSQVTVTAASAGSGWVRIMLGSTELVRHNIQVSSYPVFAYIDGPEDVIPNGATYTYYANFTGCTPTSYSWLIYGAPSSWYSYWTSGNALHIEFYGEATYDLYVWGNNSNGSDVGQMYVYAYNNGRPQKGKLEEKEQEEETEDAEEEFFTSYPNPVDDILNIEINNSSRSFNIDASFDIHMYDWMGKQVRNITTKSSNVQINVANLPNGIYLLNIYDAVNNKPAIRKIVVKH